MKHVPPHELAALCRSELAGPALARAGAHVESCRACQKSIARIRSAQMAMHDIASQGAPELGWDHIAARVYWSTSSQRRHPQRARPRWMLPLVASLSTGAVATMSLWLWHSPSATPTPVAAVLEEPPKAIQVVKQSQVPSVPTRQGLTGVLSFAQGEVKVDDQVLDFDALLQVGAVVQTGLGRAVVQFGEQSAFRIAAQSELHIKRFDRKRIELQIDGVVDVDITRRLPGQEFVVVAGGHEVVVRGTAFRVEYRAGEIGVSCTRGEVVVTDGEDMVHVPAGHAFRILSASWDKAALRSMPIQGPKLRALDRAMHMPMLPSWNETDPLGSYASVIEVQASADQLIAVDGVVLSKGNFLLRSPDGRHSLSVIDEEGVAGSPQWIDLARGQHGRARIAAPVAPATNRGGAVLRKRQMHERLGKRAAACLKPLAKKGLVAGSYVAFDLGINSDGSHRYLNVADSNLSPIIQRCFRDAVDAIQLPAGPEASFRLELSY